MNNSVSWELFGSSESSFQKTIHTVEQFESFYNQYKQKIEMAKGRMYAMVKKLTGTGAVTSDVKFLKAKHIEHADQLIISLMSRISEAVTFTDKVCQYDEKQLNSKTAKQTCEEHIKALQHMLEIKKEYLKAFESTDEAGRGNMLNNYKNMFKHLIWSAASLANGIKIHEPVNASQKKQKEQKQQQATEALNYKNDGYYWELATKRDKKVNKITFNEKDYQKARTYINDGKTTTMPYDISFFNSEKAILDYHNTPHHQFHAIGIMGIPKSIIDANCKKVSNVEDPVKNTIYFKIQKDFEIDIKDCVFKDIPKEILDVIHSKPEQSKQCIQSELNIPMFVKGIQPQKFTSIPEFVYNNAVGSADIDLPICFKSKLFEGLKNWWQDRKYKSYVDDMNKSKAEYIQCVNSWIDYFIEQIAYDVPKTIEVQVPEYVVFYAFLKNFAESFKGLATLNPFGFSSYEQFKKHMVANCTKNPNITYYLKNGQLQVKTAYPFVAKTIKLMQSEYSKEKSLMDMQTQIDNIIVNYFDFFIALRKWVIDYNRADSASNIKTKQHYMILSLLDSLAEFIITVMNKAIMPIYFATMKSLWKPFGG